MSKTKTILMSIAMVAMALLCTGCKHKQATVYFINEYKYTCAVELYEGDLKDVTDVKPQFSFIAGAGKEAVQVCKLPEPCTVVFYVGQEETDDKTLMKRIYPMTEHMAGSATVTLKIDNRGYYSVSYSNM